MNLEAILLIIIWGILAIACIAIELSTTNLITIWFAAGSIVALIVGAFDVIWYWQIVSFLITTSVSLAIGYPLLRKYLKIKPSLKTNIDALINQKAIMLDDYEAHNKNTGLAKLDGKTWTVINNNNESFKKDEAVLVAEIIGVKLVIAKITK